jgi:hypothetical protein
LFGSVPQFCLTKGSVVVGPTFSAVVVVFAAVELPLFFDPPQLTATKAQAMTTARRPDQGLEKCTTASDVAGETD